MYATYTLKDGRKVSLYYNVRILRVSKTINILFEERKFEKKLYYENNDFFFFINGEKIFLSKYDYYSIEELKNRISQKLRVTQDEMQATFMKETEKVKWFHKGIIYVLNLESKEHPKEKWSYKIPLTTQRNYWGKYDRVYYTSDLHSLIIVGKFILI